MASLRFLESSEFPVKVGATFQNDDPGVAKAKAAKAAKTRIS